MTKKTKPEGLKACYCGSTKSTGIVTVLKHWIKCDACNCIMPVGDWQSRPLTMGEKLTALAEHYFKDCITKWSCSGTRLQMHVFAITQKESVQFDMLYPTPEAAVDAAYREMTDGEEPEGGKEDQ